jgi:ribonuclease P protein subunit RPR2
MQELALERIEFLATQAFAQAPTNLELANRYIHHARRLAMGAKVPIPKHLKRHICHACKKILVPGQTMRFRLHRRLNYGSFLSVTCLQCGHITRYIIKGRARRISNCETDESGIATKNPTNNAD